MQNSGIYILYFVFGRIIGFLKREIILQMHTFLNIFNKIF